MSTSEKCITCSGELQAKRFKSGECDPMTCTVVFQSSYPTANFEEHIKQEILEKFQNAVRDSIEIGITPNWLLVGPNVGMLLSLDVEEVSGMKVWRSWTPLPEGRDVIAVRLSPTTARDENGSK